MTCIGVVGRVLLLLGPPGSGPPFERSPQGEVQHCSGWRVAQRCCFAGLLLCCLCTLPLQDLALFFCCHSID